MAQDSLQELYPGLSGWITDARKKGYSDEELYSYLRESKREALRQGATVEEINKIDGESGTGTLRTVAATGARLFPRLRPA